MTAQQAAKIIAGQKRLEDKIDALINALAEEGAAEEELPLRSLDGQTFGVARNPREPL